MAHELQDRYSKLVDAKLRATLVKKDGVIFNNRYEGNPNGDSIRQYLFVVRLLTDYTSDVLQNIANCGLFEALAEWLDEQTRTGALPSLPAGMTPQIIEAQSTGYLFAAGPTEGKYQIQCRLQYFQEVKNYG